MKDISKLKLKCAWLGYDIDHQALESLDIVKKLREQGFTKRLNSKDDHVTAVYFGDAEYEIEKIADSLKEFEITTNENLEQSEIVCSGYGILKNEIGRYAYFSIVENQSLKILRDYFTKLGFHCFEKVSPDFHISIGGNDPFNVAKPEQNKLDNRIIFQGELVLVGNDKGNFKKFYWNSKKKEFVDREEYAQKNLEKIKIDKIVLPNKPHLDPIVAYYLLMKYGKEYFPGIENADVSLWDKGDQPDDETNKKWKENNVLAIDVGEGMFNHHQSESETTSTQLVAKYLGIDDSDEISALLKYVWEQDTAGLHNQYGDMAYIVKCMYQQGKSIEYVLENVFNILEALQHKEYLWWKVAKDEFEKSGKIIKIKRGKGKMRLAIIKSDDINVSNYARRKEKASIVVQKRTSGHVFVFTEKKYQINLAELAGMLRLKELECQGCDLKSLTDGQMRAIQKQGQHELVSNWYYHPAFNSLMNGSVALKDTSPTKILFDEIIKLVVMALSNDLPENCPQEIGECLNEQCPYFKYNLRKCEYKRSRRISNSDLRQTSAPRD